MPPRRSLRRPGPRAAGPSRAPPPVLDFQHRIAAGDAHFTLCELSAAIDAFPAPAASAALAIQDQRKTAEMLSLLGLALRRSCPVSTPDMDQNLGTAYRKLRSLLAAQLSALLQQPGQELLLDLMLRTHVLRCYSRVLGGAAQQLRQRPSRRNAQATAEVLTDSAQLLGALATTIPGRDATAAEMHESQVLEAWAAAYLQLASLEDRSTHELSKHLQSFADFSMDGYRWMARDVNVSPSMTYLLSMAAVRLAALMDGGSVYGLPADAPELPCIDHAMGSGEGAHIVTDGRLAVTALVVWDIMLSAGPSDSAPPVVSPAAVFDVSVRIARGAVAAWLAPPGGPHGEKVARVGQLRIRRNVLGPLTANALSAAASALACRPAPNARWPSGYRPADIARAEALWAVCVAAMEAAMGPPAPGSDSGPGPGTAQELSANWGTVMVQVASVQLSLGDSPPGPIPAAPGPMAAAMLAAGVVPCYERLMRHTHTWPYIGGPQEWLELLSYGPLPDLAALLVTAAKVVRRTRGGRGERERGLRTRLLGNLLDARCFNAYGTASRVGEAGGSAGDDVPDGEEAGKGGGEVGSGGPQPAHSGRVQPPTQLALLLSLAAARLLPAATQGLSGEACSVNSSPHAQALCARLSEALLWCELLLAAYARAHEPLTLVGATVRVCAEAEVQATQWRTLLLRDVGLVQLLGAAARMLGDPSLRTDWGPLQSCFQRTLSLACCSVPQELRAALLAGRTRGGGGAAAATSSSPLSPAPLSWAAVWAVLGPSGTAPDPAALAALNNLMGGEPWGQCGAAAGGLYAAMMAAAALLVPPAQAEALLAAHCCGSPACSNLSGRSERALRRVACGGGCGLLRYCGEECRAAHWAAGHWGACGGAAAGQRLAQQ